MANSEHLYYPVPEMRNSDVIDDTTCRYCLNNLTKEKNLIGDLKCVPNGLKKSPGLQPEITSQ